MSLANLIKRVLAWKSLKVSPLRVLLLTAALGSTPLLPPLAHAQGGSISGQVVQPAPPVGTGGPASSPLIYVCPSTSSGVPCPATVSLYSAPQLGACSPSCAVSNPYTGDQYGNYSLFAATGVYLVQIVPVTGVTYQYLVMAVGGTVTSITISPPALLFTSSGCGPITTTGTCTFNLASQAANQIFASPNGGSGTPFFRNLVGPDFGSLITAGSVLGNCTSITTSPSFCPLTANMIPSTLNATTFSGNVQVNGALDTGSLNVYTEYAANYGLSDCGKNIQAAATFLTSVGGTGVIVVSPLCGTGQWSAVSLPAGITLDMTAGGTYNINTITFGNGSGFRGPPTAMLDGTDESAVILRSNISSGGAFIVSGNEVAIHNFGTLDGLNTTGSGAGIVITGSRASLQNGNVWRFAGDGIQTTSTGTSNQAESLKMSHVMVYANGGNNLTCTNTADGFVTNSEFENATGWGLKQTACNSWRVEHSDFGGNGLGGASVTGLSTSAILNGSLNQYIGNDFGNNLETDLSINGWDSVHSAPSSTGNVIVGNTFAGLNGTDNTYNAVLLTDTTGNTIDGNIINSITSHRYLYGIDETFVSNTPSANVFTGNVTNGLVGTGAYNFTGTAITSTNSNFSNGFSLLQNQYVGNVSGIGAGGLLCQNASGGIDLCFALDSLNILEIRGDSSGERIDLKPDGTTIAVSVVPTGIKLNGQANTFSSGAGAPSGNCTVGSLYTNASASSASTVLYVCYPANTWGAVTVP